jgi:4'-phosphopantetheinyl transferase
MTGHALPSGKIVRPPGAKPHFSERSPDFSLSHSGEFTAVAVSETPVGLDIEKLRPIDAAAVSRRFFGKEIADRAAFFSEWTKREAAIKRDGYGFPARLKETPNAISIPFAPGYAAAYSGGAGEIYLIEDTEESEQHP